MRYVAINDQVKEDGMRQLIKKSLIGLIESKKQKLFEIRDDSTIVKTVNEMQELNDILSNLYSLRFKVSFEKCDLQTSDKFMINLQYDKK